MRSNTLCLLVVIDANGLGFLWKVSNSLITDEVIEALMDDDQVRYLINGKWKLVVPQLKPLCGQLKAACDSDGYRGLLATGPFDRVLTLASSTNNPE